MHPQPHIQCTGMTNVSLQNAMWPSHATAFVTFLEQYLQENDESAATQVLDVLKPLITIYKHAIARWPILTVVTSMHAHA